MKKYLKYIIVFLILILNLGMTHKEKYYSYKEFITYYDLIDTYFTPNNDVIINSKDVMFRINAFGSIKYPNRIGFNEINGNNIYRRYIKYKNQDSNDKFHFSILFDEDVYINNISFNISGYHNNEVLKRSLYVDDELIYEDRDNNTKNISINKKVRSIKIKFNDQKEGDILELKYFKINEYKVYRHSYWTKDHIENTETYTIEYNIDDGKYVPNGTDKFVREQLTLFTPSIKLISDYVPIEKERWGLYDY